MSEHPNATMIREGFAALDRGELDIASGLADDVVWHEIGRSEPVHGRDAVLAHLSEEHDWEVRPQLHDALANDEHGVALIGARARRGDQSFDYRVIEVYHLRDGLITERWAFSDDTERIARFFS
jgi:uncharacterized protein